MQELIAGRIRQGDTRTKKTARHCDIEQLEQRIRWGDGIGSTDDRVNGREVLKRINAAIETIGEGIDRL